jgi:hypothetical protein
MWDEFFPKCGLSGEQIKRVRKATLSELAQEEGTIYHLDEIITDSPKWMEQHDTMFPEYKLTESEKMEILRVAVKTLREKVAKKSRRLYQIQAQQEETKNTLALVVPDWKDDSKIA